MKKYCFFFTIIILLVFQNCTQENVKTNYTGFWEGPHPEDIHKKFYIQLTVLNDSINAVGFWTTHNFYTAKFKIDSLTVITDSIRFYIPNWNCFYEGSLVEKELIKGGFSCYGEPFDSISLIKKNEIAQFLTESKPNCNNKNYKYQYHVPNAFEDIPAAHFQSQNDSLFIYSLLPEIIKNNYGRINSFLLIKNGNLICEEYFYGYTKNDLHQIESSTKSITSLLIGIAKDKGLLTNLQEPLYSFFPLFTHLKTGAYKKITLANVLSMTSGFSNEYEPYKEYDRIAFCLQRKLVAPPGERFIYDGGNTEILGGIIKNKSGMYADVFANEFLFKPLNINKYDWNVFKQNGFPCMGGSLQMLPRDMAKIGLLVLNKGKFKNKQIVSANWIEESTTAKVNTNISNDNYSYQWWNISLKSNNKTYETIWANGLGSQFIYIIPQLNVVIVTTGYNYENDSWAITNGISNYLYLLDN